MLLKSKCPDPCTSLCEWMNMHAQHTKYSLPLPNFVTVCRCLLTNLQVDELQARLLLQVTWECTTQMGSLIKM